MDTEQDERIRVRAHQIWEEEGRPEGRDQQHWEQARMEAEAEAGKPTRSKRRAKAGTTATEGGLP